MHIAMFASFVVISWWLLKKLRRVSDRIAALLYGLFYTVRIGTQFVKSVDPLMLAVAGCAIVSAGMIAMIVGLIHAILHDDSDPLIWDQTKAETE